jgi:uncharacterized membrane-anchored protein YhcB (DUF1043 family)
MKKIILLFCIVSSIVTTNAQNPVSSKEQTALIKDSSKQDDDGDGVINKEDACPLEKGSKTNNGCPLEVSTNKNNEDTTQARKAELLQMYNIGFPITTALKTSLAFSKNKLKADARTARNTDGYKAALDKYRSAIISYHDSCTATVVKWKNYMAKEAKHLTEQDKENQLIKITALEAENAEERKELDAKFPAIEK